MTMENEVVHTVNQVEVHFPKNRLVLLNLIRSGSWGNDSHT